MVCLELEPVVVGWKVQTNPLSYGGTEQSSFFTVPRVRFHCTDYDLSFFYLVFPLLCHFNSSIEK